MNMSYSWGYFENFSNTKNVTTMMSSLPCHDLLISTSRNTTCIDAVFYRHIEQLETREYNWYFSTHLPLSSITSRSTELNVVSYVNAVPFVREPLSMKIFPINQLVVFKLKNQNGYRCTFRVHSIGRSRSAQH